MRCHVSGCRFEIIYCFIKMPALSIERAENTNENDYGKYRQPYSSNRVEYNFFIIHFSCSILQRAAFLQRPYGCL